jgi:hypothetical protein
MFDINSFQKEARDYDRTKLLLMGLNVASIGELGQRLTELRAELHGARPRLAIEKHKYFEDKLDKNGVWYKIPRSESISFALFGAVKAEEECYDIGVKIKEVKNKIIDKVIEQANHKNPNDVNTSWDKIIGRGNM